MGLVKQIELYPLQSVKGGMAEFYTPQASHETMLVQVPAGTIDDLFVHQAQTDQLLVVRGSFVLVILQNRQYRYIPLSQQQPMVVRIPTGIPHGAINPNQEACVLVNAVLRHGPARARDYQPLGRPLPYDLNAATEALHSMHDQYSSQIA